MELDPSLQAAVARVGPLSELVDELTDFIDELMELPVTTDPRAALLMRPRAYRMAARVEEACYLLALLCYRLPRCTDYSADPVGYFVAHRDQFERIVPTLGLTGDPESEMLKAILAGRN